MKDDRKHLDGKFSVYPGHPITIAYLITMEYASYEDATVPTKHGWCVAVGNSNIPGAGGNVHSAVDVLAKLKNGMSIDEVFAHADGNWSRCDSQEKSNPDRWREGQDQADLVKPKLREKIKTWLAV